jgi:hypothetical protein
VADLLPARGAGSLGYAPATVPGASRRATVLVAAPGATAREVTVRVLCKRPGANGTLLAPGERAAAASSARAAVCRRRAYLRVSPGGRVSGSVFRSQPVRVTARRAGWARVAADDGGVGWVRRSVLC